MYITAYVSSGSSYKLQIFIHTVKPQFHIPECCVLGKFMPFLYGHNQMPIIKMFHGFYTILVGPHENIKLV
jgi:hypothetical protein